MKFRVTHTTEFVYEAVIGLCYNEVRCLPRDLPYQKVLSAELCIDPATCEHRRLLHELFVHKGWSACRIAKDFNTLRVDDWDGWTERAIKKLLHSPTAIGVFIWNKTRREYDSESEKWIIVTNPRPQWEVRRQWLQPRLFFRPRWAR